MYLEALRAPSDSFFDRQREPEWKVSDETLKIIASDRAASYSRGRKKEKVSLHTYLGRYFPRNSLGLSSVEEQALQSKHKLAHFHWNPVATINFPSHQRSPSDDTKTVIQHEC